LEYHPRGDVWRREATPEERRRDAFMEAAFNYVIAPLPDQPQGPAAPGALTLLDLEPEIVRGQLETRVSHLLRLRRGEGEGEWVRRVTTPLDAAPIRTGVEHLDVVPPPGYQFKEEVKAAPARLIRSAEPDPSGRLLPIKLAAEELPRPFTLTFGGTWP